MRKKLVQIMVLSMIVIASISIISNSIHALGNQECMCQDEECHVLMEVACGFAGGEGEVYWIVQYACCMGDTWCETGYSLMCFRDCHYSFTQCTCECTDSRCWDQ